jgi:hypothetical protein
MSKYRSQQIEVRFFEEADQEVDIAFRWYESQVTGLGYALLKVLDDAIKVIKAFLYGFPGVQKLTGKFCERH